VGPTGWLVVECDEQFHCQQVLINPRNGTRRAVGSGLVNRMLTGVISPDGRTAAIVTYGQQNGIGLYLLDLESGNRKAIAVSVTPDSSGAIAFSPDSRWLFVVTPDFSVAVVNRATGAVSTLEGFLPPLTQLVVRPAAHGGAGRSASSSAAQALTRTCCRPVPGV
jgi:WD40 repeat protein